MEKEGKFHVASRSSAQPGRTRVSGLTCSWCPGWTCSAGCYVAHQERCSGRPHPGDRAPGVRGERAEDVPDGERTKRVRANYVNEIAHWICSSDGSDEPSGQCSCCAATRGGYTCRYCDMRPLCGRCVTPELHGCSCWPSDGAADKRDMEETPIGGKSGVFMLGEDPVVPARPQAGDAHREHE